ncbi:hypothetical protein CEXT_116861 [Caerostris extrusa]|uniref:Uncharacterized protein n=1 Tax=Caerostris extrusa TaxID=172846 RepID=A0AAV4PVR6_CAEEX|nr:hypothetical protein CEXT_116861 [Caerostris extrusa]
MDTTCAAIQSEWLASLTFPEKQSVYLTKNAVHHIYCDQEEGHCSESYDAYAAALIGYSTDDDDFEEIERYSMMIQHRGNEGGKQT